MCLFKKTRICAGSRSVAIPLREQEPSGSAIAGRRQKKGRRAGPPRSGRLGAVAQVAPRLDPYAVTSCGNLWGILTSGPSGGKIAVTGAVLRAGRVLGRGVQDGGRGGTRHRDTPVLVELRPLRARTDAMVRVTLHGTRSIHPVVDSSLRVARSTAATSS